MLVTGRFNLCVLYCGCCGFNMLCCVCDLLCYAVLCLGAALVEYYRQSKSSLQVPACYVLCCAVLCCAVLCCAVLCCAVLCCAVLCCAVLCCAVLRRAAQGFVCVFKAGPPFCRAVWSQSH